MEPRMLPRHSQGDRGDLALAHSEYLGNLSTLRVDPELGHEASPLHSLAESRGRELPELGGLALVELVRVEYLQRVGAAGHVHDELRVRVVHGAWMGRAEAEVLGDPM